MADTPDTAPDDDDFDWDSASKVKTTMATPPLVEPGPRRRGQSISTTAKIPPIADKPTRPEDSERPRVRDITEPSERSEPYVEPRFKKGTPK
jgi:hypothetical protein